MLSLRLVTDYSTPGSGNLTVASLKTHLRVDSSADDTYIGILIRAAVQFVQQRTGRALLPSTWRQRLDNFPCSLEPIFLLRSPLRAVTSITYTDSDGDTQTVDSATYTATDGDPPAISLAVNSQWPLDAILCRRGAVTINFTAGYDDTAAIPTCLVHAVYLLVAHWYENREAVSEINLKPVPMAVENLLEMERVHWLDYGADTRGYDE